jgi:predicted Fe-S protein YdhL (DUF1289 family)
MMADEVESPCVRECVIDAASGWCRGCYRTLAEISYWTTFTPAQQCALLGQLEQRKVVAPHQATIASINGA